MQHFRGQIINSATMACEMSREEDLAMMKAILAMLTTL